MQNSNDFRLRSLRAVSLRNLNLGAVSGPFANGRRRSWAKNELELIQTNSDRLLDSFFTVHIPVSDKEEQLVYVSEVVESNACPNFGTISLPTEIDLSLGNCIIKVWWKPSDRYSPGHEWSLYCHLNLQLHKLHQVPSSVEDDDFNGIAMLFNLNGRIYTLPECIKDHVEKVKSPETNVVKSYSFDTIRTINSLSRSIGELKQSKLRISKQISGLVQSWQEYPNYTNTEKFHLSIRNLTKFINKQKTINDSILSEIVSKKIKISKFKQIIEEDYPIIDEMNRNKLEIIDSQIEPIQKNLADLIFPSIITELQQACLVIRDLIVIDNIHSTLRYTIMGLEFPSTIKELLDICYYNKYDLTNFNLDYLQEEHEDSHSHERKITQINAGLSYIIRLMQVLAEITCCHLKYKMVFAGSNSYIIDFTTTNTNYYPLFFDPSHVINEGVDYRETTYKKYLLKNAKFETGLNLLNKNLVLLINDVTEIYSLYYHDNKETHNLSNNIPIDCLDNFLWNLQYLLLFMTAT